MDGFIAELPDALKLYYDAMHLWETSFTEDDARFIEYYFSRRTSPQNVFCTIDEQSHELLSMLHTLPKRAVISGIEYDMRLIAGVATYPEYRGRGFSGSLIGTYAALAARTGVDALILQPATQGLFDFYKRFGFECMCTYEHRCFRVESPKSVKHTIAPAVEHCVESYNTFLSRFSGRFMRNEDEMIALIDEMSECGGIILQSGSGYVAGYAENDVFSVNELTCDITGDLLETLSDASGCGYIEFTLPKQILGGTERVYGAADVTIETVPFNMLLPLSEKARSLKLPLADFLSFERY